MRTTRACIAALGLALHGLSIAAAPAAPLRAEGTEWVLQAPGGSLRSADLVGAELRLAGGAVLRIDSAQRVSDGGARSWWAHELSVQTDLQGWKPLCAPHSDGTHYAVVLPGREQADGSLADEPASYAVSCTSGALAKCLRMGYEPWQTTPQGASMRGTYNACLRMVRADYGGHGLAYTENGRQIDVYDTQGVQQADMLPGQAFEAGWSESGAVCVHHVRVAHKLTLAELESLYPTLRGRVGEVCTEAFARAHGALTFNRSNPSGAVAR
ncbi:ADYC domain-containing protein [Roseateles sp.]|uniref:ADYC domain-containing protein n=1 Tax=Roseateles sp. TaxID=1971397 RepID=UPI003264FC4B